MMQMIMRCYIMGNDFDNDVEDGDVEDNNGNHIEEDKGRIKIRKIK